MHAFTAGAIYFGTVFSAGFALGVPRTLALMPVVGPVLAVLIELPLILVFAWLVSARILRRIPLSPEEAVIMGSVAFALLMLGEAGISILLTGRSLSEHLAIYLEAPHLLGMSGQLAFAAIPRIQTRRRHASQRSS